MTSTIDPQRLSMLMAREQQNYLATHPKSVALYERAKNSLLGGVPFSFMNGFMDPSFPLFIAEGRGAHVTDVDGNRYLDLLAGDLGAIFGHSPPAVADAIAQQAHRGIMFTLPSEDAIWVGEELTRRYGLPLWQLHMSASDSVRTAIKISREVTKRHLTLMFNGSYHGTVDETCVAVVGGKMITHPKAVHFGIGMLPNPESRTRVVDPYDLDAVEKALSPRDVACVITEPTFSQALRGPFDEDFHVALRDLTRRYGTKLIIDETHGIGAAWGGCTRLWNLEPDIFVAGKGIAGGMPASVMGLSREVADSVMPLFENFFVAGIGSTLSGNALAVAALRANLEHVMTESAYERMMAAGERMAKGMQEVVTAADLPWRVSRWLGYGVRVGFSMERPRTMAEAHIQGDEESFGIRGDELTQYFHAFYVNRGIIILALALSALNSPAVTNEDVDYYVGVFGECVNELIE